MVFAALALSFVLPRDRARRMRRPGSWPSPWPACSAWSPSPSTCGSTGPSTPLIRRSRDGLAATTSARTPVPRRAPGARLPRRHADRRVHRRGGQGVGLAGRARRSDARPGDQAATGRRRRDRRGDQRRFSLQGDGRARLAAYQELPARRRRRADQARRARARLQDRRIGRTRERPGHGRLLLLHHRLPGAQRDHERRGPPGHESQLRPLPDDARRPDRAAGQRRRRRRPLPARSRDRLGPFRGRRARGPGRAPGPPAERPRQRHKYDHIRRQVVTDHLTGVYNRRHFINRRRRRRSSELPPQSWTC